MKDNRDPRKVGFVLLSVAGDPGDPERNLALSSIADGLSRHALPDFRGDESPIERYGDPRSYDVEVTTTVRRVPLPIEKLTRGPGPVDRRPRPQPDGGAFHG